MIKMEILYFDGCPSWKPALENLEKVIETEKISAEIGLVKIASPEQAQIEEFLGSPSFRVDGIDLWPEKRENYTLRCRIYNSPSGMQGYPTTKMLREEIRRALDQ